ncbi:subtilisin-like protein [Marssonina coronariae]|uniref:Subtilisin-like protein n=1 Tax=Diplocarpon coronariae TaxID=2795749 RepID=A0A218Z6K7_9HELO|nr:subtilisin-like protein [Marssonina coronariae]
MTSTAKSITLKVVDSQTLIEGPARSEPDESKLYFISSASESQDWLTGGLTSSFSSWRPTLDTLAIKPPLYDAIQSDSAVSPSELNVDDPDQIRSTPSELAIENLSSQAKTHVVSHEPAALVRVVPYNYPDAGPVGAVRSLQSPCADSAEVKFSETTVTHPAGPSTDITESIEPPQDADPISRPVFPGIIDVKNHGAFRIPCLGQPASPSPLLEAEPLMTGPGSQDAMERRAGVRERPAVGNVAEDYERWSSPLIRTDALADTTTLARRDRLRIRWGARLFWLGCAVAERSARE